MNLTEYLNKARVLSNDATPFFGCTIEHSQERGYRGVGPCGEFDQAEHDAEFIAFSRDAVPKLCEALERAIYTLRFNAAGEEMFGNAGAFQKNAQRALADIEKIFGESL